MKTTKEKVFFSFSFLCTKLCFFILLLVAIKGDNASADLDPTKVFSIMHDRECSDRRTATAALLENKFFSHEQAEVLQSKLNSKIQSTRQRRLGESLVNIDVNVMHPLSDMDWKSRRDLNIAVLEIQIYEELGKTRKDNETALLSDTTSAFHEFLPDLAMDILNGGVLPDGLLFTWASGLLCLAHPPIETKFYDLTSAPNDYDEKKQWYLGPKGINAVKAWECQNGQSTGPVVAVIDSGCTPHPDLERNLCSCKEGCFGFDVDKAHSNPHNEILNHGTTVSGFVAAVSNNNFGIAGVCWGCRIMCVKTSFGTTLPNWAISAAIQYVLRRKGMVRVTNHSYRSFGGTDHGILEGHKALQAAGILSIAASGNDNCNMEKYRTYECTELGLGRVKMSNILPADLNLDNILTVGASDRFNRRSSFSNFGKTKVDLFAPGEDVLGLCNTRNQGCQLIPTKGTSFASPLVAGAAALLFSLDPDLTYLEVKEIMMKTVRKVPALADACVSGGILDLGAAMEEVKKRGKECSPVSHDIPTPVVDRTNDFYGPDFCDKTPDPPTQRFPLTDDGVAFYQKSQFYVPMFCLLAVVILICICLIWKVTARKFHLPPYS